VRGKEGYQMTAEQTPAGAAWRMMTPRDVFRLPQPAPRHTVVYGPGAEQLGDLYLPEKHEESGARTPEPFPLVVVLHGGCWMAAADRKHVSLLCAHLAERGMAVWNVEYRRVRNPEGGWPWTFEDVALAWQSRHLLRDFGVDVARCVLLGHSAGGQLALWLACGGPSRLGGPARVPARVPASVPASVPESRPASPSPLPAQVPDGDAGPEPLAVLALAPITDLARSLRSGGCQAVVPGLLNVDGTGLEARLQQTSPLHMGAPRWPVVLLSSGLDKVVPLEQAEVFVAQGYPGVTHHHLPDTGHFELVTPGAPGFETVLASLQSLLSLGPNL